MTENQIQRAIFTHLRQRAAKGVFAFAVPNGGYRRRTEASIMKGTGTVAGVPDVILLKQGRMHALELKTEKGKLSENQVATHLKMAEAGCSVHVAHGLTEALRWLEAGGFLKGRAA